MTFQEQIAADLAGIIDTGETKVSIVYMPKGGSPVTRNAVALAEEILIEQNEQGETKLHQQDFVLLTDSVKGIASPQPDDIITYGGLDRRIVSVNNITFGKARLSTTAPELQSRHNEMHKKKIT